RLGNPYGRSHIELRVGFDANLELGTSLPHATNHFSHFADGLQCSLPAEIQALLRPDTGRVGLIEEWVPFAGQRSFRHQFLHALPVRVGTARNVSPAVACVNLDVIVDLATQQLVDRYIQLLPDDVPQRDIYAGDGRLHRAAVH